METLTGKSMLFNVSMFKENQANRWQFLEQLSPSDGKQAGLLISSPTPVLVLTTSYILFVCIIGPLFMRNREPFRLKNTIRLYNLYMVYLAARLMGIIYDAVGSTSNLIDCDKTFTFSDDSASKVYQHAGFIMSVRLSEYLDTIFFTLRKKQNQVTFLHVFHHAFVPMYAYWILRTAPVRFNVYIILINSAIHVLMYFYYFLATFQAPREADGAIKEQQKVGLMMTVVNQLLKFKKYMTQLQILQFVSLAMYASYAAVQPNQCNIPKTYLAANLLLAFGFLGLFLHFYRRAYKQAARLKAKRG